MVVLLLNFLHFTHFILLTYFTTFIFIFNFYVPYVHTHVYLYICLHLVDIFGNMNYLNDNNLFKCIWYVSKNKSNQC